MLEVSITIILGKHFQITPRNPQILTDERPYQEIPGDYRVGAAISDGKPPSKAAYPLLPTSDHLWDILYLCWNLDPSRRSALSQLRHEISDVVRSFSLNCWAQIKL